MEAGLLHTDKHGGRVSYYIQISTEAGITCRTKSGLVNLSRWSLSRGAFLEEKAMENIFCTPPISAHGSASHGEGFAIPHGSKAGVLDLP